MTKKTNRQEDPSGGRSALGGIDLLLAAFAARGHVAKAWEELLAAADAFLAALEPVLERGSEGKSEPAKAALGVVKRLRAQIVQLRRVSVFAAVDLVLSLGRTLSGFWRAGDAVAEVERHPDAEESDEPAPVEHGTNGKAAAKATKRAGHAERIKISGQE